MAKQNGLILKWGFCLILLTLTLSWAVWGAERQPQPLFDTKLVNNFEVFDADIRDAFRGLAEYGGFNLLMDKKVQGNVTIKFQAGITTKEAIDVLAKTNGYSCYWMTAQHTVVVGDEATYKNLDTVYTKVYNLKYADPEAVAETLKVIVPKDRLGLDKRTNQLVVRGNILEQENVCDAIVGLDREMPQISIEMRIEETTREALDKLGVGWTPDTLSLNLDSPKFTHISAVNLNFWEQSTNSKILARPMIATTDSKEASIFIGDKVPVTEKTVDDDDITYTVKYIDVGTKLMVTPRINDNNIVTVNVKATLSNITGWTEIGSGTEAYTVPNVRNREVGSVIRLRDGETFMLSGLNQTESTLTKTGLKGLKSIPLIGKLFQNTVKEDPANGTEIVIFVTPRIVRLNPVEQPQKAENVASTPTAAKLNDVPTPEKKAEPVAVQTTPVTVKAQPVATVPTKPVTNTQAVASIPATTDTKPAVNVPATAPVKPVAANQPLPLIKFEGQQRLTVKVKPNETVAQIASLYGVSRESILKDNNLAATAPLKVGQELLVSIPGDHFYRLAPKETLWRISKRYGVSQDVLKEINQLEDVTKVQSGQTVILPVSVTAIASGDF
jgi:type II secretory pathway component GspD/PulD (secretin)/LysM repeat protein